MRRDRRAYSTLELLIALSIIGLTTAIAAPRYFSSVRRTKLERVTELVAADLSRARDNARAYGLDQTVTFTNERYRVTTRTASANTNVMIDLSVDPYEGSVSRVRTGSYSAVTFNKYGLPSNPIVIGFRSGGLLRVLTMSTSGEVQVLEGAPAKTVAQAEIADASMTATMLAAPVGPN
jgi:Tfp pilus assembly protein FimT